MNNNKIIICEGKADLIFIEHLLNNHLNILTSFYFTQSENIIITYEKQTTQKKLTSLTSIKNNIFTQHNLKILYADSGKHIIIKKVIPQLIESNIPPSNILLILDHDNNKTPELVKKQNIPSDISIYYIKPNLEKALNIPEKIKPSKIEHINMIKDNVNKMLLENQQEWITDLLILLEAFLRPA